MFTWVSCKVTSYILGFPIFKLKSHTLQVYFLMHLKSPLAHKRKRGKSQPLRLSLQMAGMRHYHKKIYIVIMSLFVFFSFPTSSWFALKKIARMHLAFWYPFYTQCTTRKTVKRKKIRLIENPNKQNTHKFT